MSERTDQFKKFIREAISPDEDRELYLIGRDLTGNSPITVRILFRLWLLIVDLK